MLIRADPGTKTISLLSFPRDLGVPIYCPKQAATPRRATRSTPPMPTAGPQGTLDTVKHLTNLPINYLITVNFHGFKEIVDKLGGIWMDIDRRYYNVNTGTAAENYANINLQPGYQKLTGEQALDFVRFRHTDDDYHRLARQQEFVRALKQQFAQQLRPAQAAVDRQDDHAQRRGRRRRSSDKTVAQLALFASRLPGGHFFQDKIQGVTGDSETQLRARRHPEGGQRVHASGRRSSRRRRTPRRSARR